MNGFEAKPRLDKQTTALRVVKEFKDGMIVNLGAGMPSLAAAVTHPDIEVMLQSENGVLGFGPLTADPEEMNFDLVNASGHFITGKPGMSVFDSAESFAMFRARKIDLCVLGALQVSEKGDLANWSIPGRKLAGNIGGAMDLARGAKRIIAVMTHTTAEGDFKIVKQCTCELTASRCVDLIITDIAVLQVTNKGLVLIEVAPGWNSEDVQKLTEPKLIISPDLKEMEL